MAAFASPLLAHVRFGLLGARIGFWEETLFRGDLLGALRRRMSAPAAVLVSSVVFALYHLHLDDVTAPPDMALILSLLGKFLFGAAFAVVALRARSLVPSAIAHALLWAIMCDH